MPPNDTHRRIDPQNFLPLQPIVNIDPTNRNPDVREQESPLNEIEAHPSSKDPKMNTHKSDEEPECCYPEEIALHRSVIRRISAMTWGNLLGKLWCVRIYMIHLWEHV